MRIVNRTTFLSLPAGTLFSKYQPHCFDDLCIKGDTLGSDFYVQQINDAVDCHDSSEFGDILDTSERTGESFALDLECESRDGMFDEEQLFAVWDESDVRNLIERLNKAITQTALKASAQ